MPRCKKMDAYLTLLPATVFAKVCRQRGGGEMPPGTSRVLEHIATKFQRQSYVFWVILFSGGTSGFVERRCVLKIQDGSQITGNTNDYAGFTDTHVVPKTIHGFMTTYET